MHLKLVPPQKQETHQTHRSSTFGSRLNDNFKLAVLSIIMCFVPLMSYTFGAKAYGTEMGTHIGFITGACCMLVAAYLIYFSNWFQEYPED
ncbi:MAG: hypothetical protein ACON4U_04355 [Myxococcota bacterium]